MDAIVLSPSRGREWWIQLGKLAIRRYFEQEGAAVWAEVEAQLAESPWIHYNLDSRIPPTWRPHALYLADSRARLVDDGLLEELPAVVGGLPVSAWADPRVLTTRGRATAVLRQAASKRRLYRRFLVWAGDSELCGRVAEALVERTLRDLHGTHLWIPPGTRSGGVSTLLGRPLEVGGPLDAAALWAFNPDNPNEGFLPFGAEVKNIRAPVYPWSSETWDLLAKLAAFPDVLPILVARRINPTAFRFFKDLGVLGTELHQQLFSAAIDAEDFARVTKALKLHNAVQVAPDFASRGLSRFFRKTGPEYGRVQLERWRTAAPIVARYPELRAGRDRAAWLEFCREIIASGLYERGGWAPRAAHYAEDDDEEMEPDEDWWEE